MREDVLPNRDFPHKNVLLLAICQALAMTGNSVLFTTAALIGNSLASDKTWATFPLALLHLATMSVTFPAALLMQRIGRQVSFMVGALIGMMGAALGVYSVLAGDFLAFCGATVLFGSFNAFVGYYRFAAADLASEAFRARAISWVVAGGIVAALLGPQLAAWSKDLVPPTEFAGSLASIFLLQSFVLVLLSRIPFPPPPITEKQPTERPWWRMATQPVFMVAVLGSMLGYGVMVLVMTATPLAMVAEDFSFDQAAFVIQWHLLGMFAPSLLTGSLIQRFGVLTIMLIGGVLSLICVGINLMGSHLMHYWVALLLLGVGWNFLFVGSTTLLTEVYLPNEKGKAQALHDFLMFASVALCSLVSGGLLNTWGWGSVNLAGIPLLALVIVAILSLGLPAGRIRIDSR